MPPRSPRGNPKHVDNVFDEGELDAASNVHFLHVANSDKPVKYYSLDVIISVEITGKSTCASLKQSRVNCSHMYFLFTWFLNCFAAAPAVRPSTRAAVA